MEAGRSGGRAGAGIGTVETSEEDDLARPDRSRPEQRAAAGQPREEGRRDRGASTGGRAAGRNPSGVPRVTRGWPAATSKDHGLGGPNQLLPSGSSISEKRSERYKACHHYLRMQRDNIAKHKTIELDYEHYQKWCSRRSPTGFWIDSNQARALFYVTIVLNTTFYALQAYLADVDDIMRSKPYFYAVFELPFVVVFASETFLRIQAAGSHFWEERWNLWDAALVLLCFIDAAILCWLPAIWDIHRLVVHLMPTFQLLRLGRFFQELRLIIAGIFNAMRAVLWAVVLLFLVVYFFAVLMTNIIGHSGLFEGDEVILANFSHLTSAMFTLFTFATLEDFPDTIRHLMDSGLKGAVVATSILAFMIFANLALLNLVTAVMVDSVMDILPGKRTERLARERSRTVKRLAKLFLKMDENKDERLTLEEFEYAVKNFEDLKTELDRLRISEVDARELFMLIDFQHRGHITEDELIYGLLRDDLDGPASRKDLMGVQYDLHQMWNMLGSGQESIQAVLKEMRSDGSAADARDLHARQCEHFSHQQAEEVAQRAAQQAVRQAEEGALRRMEELWERRTAALCDTLVGQQKDAVLRALEASPTAARVDEARAALEEGLREISQALQAPQRQAGNLLTARALRSRLDVIAERLEGCAGDEGCGSGCRSFELLQPGHGEPCHERGHTQRLPLPGSPPQASPARTLLASAAPSLAEEAASTLVQQLSQRAAVGQPSAAAGAPLPPAPWPPRLAAPARPDPWAASAPSVAGRAEGHQGRLAAVEQWVRSQDWQGLPFDKLVLQLDRLGVALTRREQDQLRRRLGA